jgi:selenocysteine lyase/cysteine desulfurase
MNPRSTRLIETIRNSIVGDDATIEGPFGPRRVTYADYTASGRSLTFIEDFIRGEVMPLYANTHTETSRTGQQTTRFREDARALIHKSVGGGPEDAVIFAGSGATGAINKLLDILNIRIPKDLDKRYDLRDQIPENERPVVFIGPYEHHSNELPWRESIADVVVIEDDADGKICLPQLEAELQRYQARKLKIGSFSAASNVTGIGSKTGELAILLHRYGALSFWDFAAAGPYVQIEMNMASEGPDGHLAYKDAIVLSPHKFIGGPGTPGVLVVKKHLLKNTVPSCPGGGTVCFVSRDRHSYIDDVVHREEGGTPAIIESIRSGLVFQLKEAVGSDTIREREEGLIKKAIASWSANPNIRILGNKDAWRLSIVSFMVRHKDQFIHHNFVVALLNDLLGIQARGGCSCAGPYAHRLLGIDDATSDAIRAEAERGVHGIKPGWVRVNFNYFISPVVFDFLIQAVHLVANEGWKLLPMYRFSPNDSLWRHREFRPEAVMRLADLSYRTGKLEYRTRHSTEPEWSLPEYLGEARRIIDAAVAAYASEPPPPVAVLDPEFRRIRWFPLPNETWRELTQGGAQPIHGRTADHAFSGASAPHVPEAK